MTENTLITDGPGEDLADADLSLPSIVLWRSGTTEPGVHKCIDKVLAVRRQSVNIPGAILKKEKSSLARLVLVRMGAQDGETW
jgi:hypothetical protein